MIAKKSKIPLPTTSDHYPFVSAKAKTPYEETLQGKHPAKERALDPESYKVDEVVMDVIKGLDEHNSVASQMREHCNW